MDIIEALKQENSPLRISNGNRWLFWDYISDEWVVMQHRYNARRSVEVYRGNSEALAVEELMDEARY